MAARCFWLVLLVIFCAGCKPRIIGEEAAEVITSQQPPPPPPKPRGPPPELPPPPMGSWTAPPRPTPVPNENWGAGEPALPEAVAVVTVNQNASFEELSQQFAETRARQQILPTGGIELEVLYDAAMRTPFQGKGELKDRFAFFNEWSKQQPDDATPLILLARLHVIWGWEARGSGFAGTVSEDGFRLFDERLQAALVYARAAEKLEPQDPELYKVLVDLAKGLRGKREHVDRWVETGRKIQANYYPLYDATSEYLLPRWHGEQGDIEEFAEKLCAAIGGDDGLEAYARIALQTNMYDSTMLYTSDYDGRKIAAGAAIMEQRYPQATTLLNFLAVIAWKEQNQPLARKYLERLKKTKVDLRQFGTERRYAAFVAYCTQQTPADRPDQFHWPYLHGAYDMTYVDGGRGFLTTPRAPHELVRIWNRADLSGPVDALPEFPDTFFALVADAAGQRIILTAGNPGESHDVVITLDHLASPQPRAKEPIIHSAEGQRRGTAISPNGQLAATCRNKTLHLWNPATGLKVLQLPGEFEFPQMCFSPDNKQLLVVAQNKFRVFDVADGKLIREYSRAIPPNQQYGATLNRAWRFLDSQTVIGDGVVWPRAMPAIIQWTPADDRVVELMRLEVQRQLMLDDLSPNLAIFSESTRGTESTIYIMRRADGKLIRTINGHSGRVRQTLLSPDESELATVEDEGPIRFWKLTGK